MTRLDSVKQESQTSGGCMNRHKSLKLFLVSGAAALVLLCASVMSASAQSFEQIVVDVPFAFNAVGKNLPAGRYIVRGHSPVGPIFIVKADDSNDGRYVLTNLEQSTTTPDRAELVFHRYGESYFLSEVWSGVSDVGYRLAKSKAERMAERNQTTDPSRAGTAM